MGNLISRITDCQRQMKSMFEVFDGTTPRVLILGLDGAGKTTLMYSAKLDDCVYAIAPPRGVIIEHVTPRRGATMQLFDLPGSKLNRHLWHNWFPKTEAVIFVVDSADKIRIDEAKFEIHDLLTSRWLRKVPLIVVANKQDVTESMSEDEVAKELDLQSIANRDWSIFGVSAKKAKGVMNIFVDTMEKIKAYRHYKNSLTDKIPEKKHTDERETKKVTSKGDGSPVFTSIEDSDAMEEKVPSLFASINNKIVETNPDTEDEAIDSGLSSRESVMYDQIDDPKEMIEEGMNKQPDSVNDDESAHSVHDNSDDSGQGEDVLKEQSEQLSIISSSNSGESDDASIAVETNTTENNSKSELDSDESDKSDNISEIQTDEVDIRNNSKTDPEHSDIEKAIIKDNRIEKDEDSFQEPESDSDESIVTTISDGQSIDNHSAQDLNDDTDGGVISNIAGENVQPDISLSEHSDDRDKKDDKLQSDTQDNTDTDTSDEDESHDRVANSDTETKSSVKEIHFERSDKIELVTDLDCVTDDDSESLV